MHNVKKTDSTKKTEGEFGSNGMMKMLFIIVIAIIIVIPIVCSRENKEDKKEDTTSSNTSETSYKEVLELIGYGYVGGTRTEWITPTVNYRFKLRSEGHAYFVQFSTENGGWTKKILIPAEGDDDKPLPDGVVQGPVRITPGPNETREFRVQLYKKINIKT